MKGTLPTWLERTLGADVAESGEGTIWKLDYHWPLLPWVSLLAAAAVVALVVFFYLREAGAARRSLRIVLIGMRLALFAILAFMLAQFALSLERTGLPYLVLAIDDSASMGIVDRYDDSETRAAAEKVLRSAKFDKATRLNLAKALALNDDGELLREVARRHKLRLYFMSDTARGETGDTRELLDKIRKSEPTGETSRLGQGIRTILNDLRGAPPSAIVLFTDGVTTAGEPLAEAAAYSRRKGVPLFTVGLGSPKPNRDLLVSDLLVEDVVFVDDTVNFEFKLTGHGYEGQRVEVQLNSKSAPTPLAKTTFVVGPDGEARKGRIAFRPREVGDFEFIVETPALPDEAQPENNRQERLVSVRKEQIRVLLAEGLPTYEYRFLKNLLERDATIKLHTLLQDAEPGYAEIDKSALRSFPVRREELFEYDVLILGDVNPTALGATVMRNISDFVTEKGGGLVFISGRRYTPTVFRDTPLDRLLPLEFDGATAGLAIVGRNPGFQVTPTELGLASPAMQLGDTPEQTREIWSKLPELYWLFEVSKLKPAVRVLAEHPIRTGADGMKLPLICLQYVGSGKVLFHSIDSTWRWRYRVGDVFLARYWVQSIRYLSRAKLLGKDRAAELAVDRREYRRGEPVKLRVRFSDDRQAPAEDDGVAVVVEAEGGKNQRVQLHRATAGRGLFEGVMSDLDEGRYHAWIVRPTMEGAAPATDFLIAAAPGEFLRMEMDATELQRASSETRGRYFTLVTAGDLSRNLPEGRQVPIEALQPLVLWNKWPLLLLFLTLIVGEWTLRKRRGMV